MTRSLVPFGEARTVVTLSAHIKSMLEGSICRHQPEHYAVFLGDPDKDPFHVVDAAVIPPMTGADGRYDRSATHIRPNPSVIEYYLNVSWIPRGLYPIGLIHTHPGSMDRLSGSFTSTDGDVPALRKMLANAAAYGRPLQHVIAPIINLDQPGGGARYTGWIVRSDVPRPIQTELRWVPEQPAVSRRSVTSAAFDRIDRFTADLTRLQSYPLPKSATAVAERLLANDLRRDLEKLGGARKRGGR